MAAPAHPDDFHALVAHTVAARMPGAQVQSMRQLTTGSSAFTWRLQVRHADGAHQAMVVRRDATADRGDTPASTRTSKAQEYAIQAELATTGNFPVAPMLAPLPDYCGMGGYLMGYVPGETLGGRINREPQLAAARAGLAFQLGAAAAHLHRTPPPPTLGLTHQTTADTVREYRTSYHNYREPHPVFAFAWAWLAAHPLPDAPPCLVHGDYRNGNIVVNATGLAAVLDWELCHIGNPLQDLGWLCCNTWRFGNREYPVGGFGTISDLMRGYASVAGTPPWLTEEAIRAWMLFGTLRWGVMCMTQGRTRLGDDAPAGIAMERLAVGRRVSETELELMLLLAKDACHDLPATVAAWTGDATPTTHNDAPSHATLIDGLAHYLHSVVVSDTLPAGLRYYHRVARNLVGTIGREQQLGAVAASALVAQRRVLLADKGCCGSRQALCAAMSAGTLDLTDPALRRHLALEAYVRLAIDNPRFSSFQACQG